MSGLDKIAETIVGEAQEKANKIKIEAREKVQSIEAEAAKDNEALKRDLAEDIERQADAVIERYASDARQERRRVLLKTRSDAIEDVISSAKNRIINMPERQYFDMMRQICVRNARAGEGVLHFAQPDMDRLPGDFIDRCNSEINDGFVVLGEPVINLDHGFLIGYGKVVQNCSLESIFEINKNQIWDAVNACLNEEA